MTLRFTTCHENALSPLGERVARDGAFTSRGGSGKGVRLRYVHGSKESRPDLCILTQLRAGRDSSLRSQRQRCRLFSAPAGGVGDRIECRWVRERPLKNFGDALLHPREFLSDFLKSLPLFLCFLFRSHSILLQTF